MTDIMTGKNSADGNGQANARLIASAPDLLEAVKRLLQVAKASEDFKRNSIKDQSVYRRHVSIACAQKALHKATGGREYDDIS